MANPFAIQSLGGRNPANNLQQIVGAIQAKGAQEKLAERRAQGAQVLQTGDPDLIADFMANNPDLAQGLNQSLTFKNQLTKQNALDSMQNILSGGNAEEILKDRVQMVVDQGGDPTQTMAELQQYRQNPEQFIKNTEIAFSMMADPNQWRQYRESTGQMAKDGINIGTYNPRDYTTTSWAEFRETGDPSKLQRYTSKTISIAGVPYKENPETGEYEQIVSTEEVVETEAKTAGAIEASKQQAKSEQKKADTSVANQEAMAATTQLLGEIDEFLANDDYVLSISGYSGRLPSVRTGAIDAEQAFNNILDQLTLGNLSKMSGPKTDKDIEVIKSAAAGVRPGMSESALRARFDKIKAALSRVLQNQDGNQIEEAPAQESVAPINFDQMSDEEFLNSLDF